jgi:peptidoglycan/LPS O-acetylase OafA/YrhL
MNKIISLQYLRAFACISVLVTHVLQILKLKPFGNYFLSGQYGVDLFFILSGFVIYYTTKENISPCKFMTRRIFRIFPAYLFCLFLYSLYNIVFQDEKYSLFYIFQNIIMMPFSESIGTRVLIVGQAWSTCYEMYFYLLMAFIIWIGRKKKNVLLALFSLFVLFLVIGKLNLFGLSKYGFFRFVYSLAASVHIFKFAAGIFIAIIFKRVVNTIQYNTIQILTMP